MIPSSTTIYQVPQSQPDDPLVAIGDVHGRLPQFERALAYAASLIECGRVAGAVVLGDVVDRGPDSLGCLRKLAEFRRQYPTDILMGNHEQFMLTLLFHPDERQRRAARFNWLSRRNGGAWALAFIEQLPAMLADMDLGPDAWGSHHENGNVILVHAGAPAFASPAKRRAFLDLPALGLPEEYGSSLPHWAWIRRGFIEEEDPLPGYFVVHGHTKTDYTGTPLVGRLNLDASGVDEVAAAVIEKGEVEVATFAASSSVGSQELSAVSRQA